MSQAERLYAIDPGSTQSGIVIVREAITLHVTAQLLPNEYTLSMIRDSRRYESLVVEEMNFQPRDRIGRDVHRTNLWAGRFFEAFNGNRAFLLRRKVQQFWGARKDADIRAAVIDSYGGRNKAIGGIRCKQCKGQGWRGRGRSECGLCKGSGWTHRPGPFHGVTSHCWQALALGLAYLGGARNDD